jgi:hypothetical protein
MGVLGHAGAALRWQMAGRLFRRVDFVATVHSIFTARRRLRCVKACLMNKKDVSKRSLERRGTNIKNFGMARSNSQSD